MADPTTLTDRQRDILREYARGAQVADLADRYGEDRDRFGKWMVRVCGLNRNTARELVRNLPPQRRLPAINTAPARPAVVASTRPATPPARATPQPVLEPAAAPAKQPVEVLERWHVHRCALCRYVGPADDHLACGDRVAQLRPVAVLVVPREGS